MLSKKTLGFLLKITIVGFALYFLYHQLTNKQAIEDFDIVFIKQTILENQPLVVLVFLMMFFNWLIEAVKWKFLIGKIEKISSLRMKIFGLSKFHKKVTKKLTTASRLIFNKKYSDSGG